MSKLDELILKFTGIYNFSDSNLKRQFLKDIKSIEWNGNIPAEIRKILYRLKGYYEASEHIKRNSGNLNKDKTFYIVRMANVGVGWAFYSRRFIYQIDKAVKNGWIPVVDMSSYDNSYKRPGSKRNSWCDYFEQPCGYSLQTALRSKNVIYAPVELAENMLLEERSGVSAGDIEYWRCLSRKYIRYNKKTEEYLKEQYDRVIKGKRTLGVVCRGTEYVVNKPYMHGIMPSEEEILAKTEECLREWDCEQVYLATEDKEIFGTFKKKFNDKLVYVDCKRYERSQEWLMNNEEYKRVSPWQRGIDYLTTLYLLSRCNCFIATSCGARWFAFRMTEGFEKQYTYDLGFYGIDDDAYTLTPSGKPIYVKGNKGENGNI